MCVCVVGEREQSGVMLSVRKKRGREKKERERERERDVAT